MLSTVIRKKMQKKVSPNTNLRRNNYLLLRIKMRPKKCYWIFLKVFLPLIVIKFSWVGELQTHIYISTYNVCMSWALTLQLRSTYKNLRLTNFHILLHFGILKSRLDKYPIVTRIDWSVAKRRLYERYWCKPNLLDIKLTNQIMDTLSAAEIVEQTDFIHFGRKKPKNISESTRNPITC